jgi:hypothetical protein
VIAAEDLNALGEAVLDANLPPGFAALPGTLEIEHLGKPSVDASGAARFPVRIRRALVAQLPVGEAISLSLGRTPEQARARLSAALPLASPPLIRLWPAWWPRLPLLPFQVSVDQVDQP